MKLRKSRGFDFPTETFRPSGCDLPLTRHERQELNVLCRSRKKRPRDSWPLSMRDFNRAYFLQWFCQRGFNGLTVRSERWINFREALRSWWNDKSCKRFSPKHLRRRELVSWIYLQRYFVPLCRYFSMDIFQQREMVIFLRITNFIFWWVIALSKFVWEVTLWINKEKLYSNSIFRLAACVYSTVWNILPIFG